MNIRVVQEVSDRKACGVPQFDANDLTGGGNLAQITLGEQVYVLRITRAGKLILTK